MTSVTSSQAAHIEQVASAWVSKETRAIAVQEILAGGWVTFFERVGHDGSAGSDPRAPVQVLMAMAGDRVHEAVSALLGTIAHSLAYPIDGPATADTFALTHNCEFGAVTAGAVLLRLPMAPQRRTPFLASLHRDLVDAARASTLRGQWWETTIGSNGNIELVIDRSKVPAADRERTTLVKARPVRFGAASESRGPVPGVSRG